MATHPESLVIWLNHPVAMFVVAVIMYLVYRILYQQGGGDGR